MIIIESKNGVYFVNESEIISFAFDQEKGEASYTLQSDRVIVEFRNGMPYESRIATVKYSDVESVRYVNSAKPKEYYYEGSEVKRLNGHITYLEKQRQEDCEEMRRLRNRVSDLTDELNRLKPRPHADTSSGYNAK